jgi:hypothetical protein
MSERERQGPGGPGDERYASGDNPADRNEHRHGPVVHSHEHTGPHEHGDDYEYDEAHDPDARPPRAPGAG